MTSPNDCWLPVRCCCNGARILGFLKLRCAQASAGRTLVTDSERQTAARSVADMLTPKVTTIRRWPITIRIYGNELAVYSEDRPIEYWRDVPGFVEVLQSDDHTGR